MAATDLSGDINGLIILASASLGISQYVYSSYKQRFTETQNSLQQAWTDRADVNTERRIIEKFGTRFGDLSIQSLDTLGLNIIILFGILNLTAGIKIVDSVSLVFSNKEQFQPFLIIAVAVLSAGSFVLIFWTGISLMKLREKVKNFERDVGIFVNEVRIARQFSIGGT